MTAVAPFNSQKFIGDLVEALEVEARDLVQRLKDSAHTSDLEPFIARIGTVRAKAKGVRAAGERLAQAVARILESQNADELRERTAVEVGDQEVVDAYMVIGEAVTVAMRDLDPAKINDQVFGVIREWIALRLIPSALEDFDDAIEAEDDIVKIVMRDWDRFVAAGNDDPAWIDIVLRMRLYAVLTIGALIEAAERDDPAHTGVLVELCKKAKQVSDEGFWLIHRRICDDPKPAFVITELMPWSEDMEEYTIVDDWNGEPVEEWLSKTPA